MTYQRNMPGALFLVFLGQLLRGATRKIYGSCRATGGEVVYSHHLVG